MAKSLTITIQDDEKAIELLDCFCYNHKYDSNKRDSETKLDFMKRVTISWWIGQASQGKNRQTFSDQVKVFNEMVIE